LGEEGARIAEAGGIAIELVEQGASGGEPATQADLDAWIDTFDLEIATVHPSDGALEQLEGREHTYVIDLSTMEIVFETTYGDGPEAAIEDILARLEG
jgi:hypothetical protein